MTSMKALAVNPGAKTIELMRVPKPSAPGAGEVRARTLELGVCGTDKEIARFEYGTPPPDSDFLILGHECLGEVMEVGAGVDSFSPGDLVVPRVRRPCPHARCSPCRHGRSDYCVTGDFTERGIVGAHGFGCEEWVEAAAFLHRVPARARGFGVLTEPLTIAEKALATFDTVQERLPGGRRDHRGRNALVIGSGAVGLLGAMTLLRAGFETFVYARTPQPNLKATVSEGLGATYLSSREVPSEALEPRIGALDFVYEAAGASQTAFEVMSALGPNGVFILTGVPGRKQPVQLDGGSLMKQIVLANQVVLGTVNAGPDAFAAAIDDLVHFSERWPGPIAQLVTHRHAPEEAPEVLRSGVGGGIKHVIVFA